MNLWHHFICPRVMILKDPSHMLRRMMIFPQFFSFTNKVTDSLSSFMVIFLWSETFISYFMYFIFFNLLQILLHGQEYVILYNKALLLITELLCSTGEGNLVIR